jgi:hypothetical protein
MTLILEVVAGWVGLGIVGYLIRRFFATTLSELQTYLISGALLSVLILVLHVSTNYSTYPRHLADWQREALAKSCPSVPPVAGRITYYIGTAPGELSAQDYSREFMDVFADRGCRLSIAYGYDPSSNHIVINQGKVIVPPDIDLLLRVDGIELWVLDPQHPPIAAEQMAQALTTAGISFVWRPDIRLAGIETYDTYRFKVNGPDGVLFIGRKSPWRISNSLYVERRHLEWKLRTLRASLAAFGCFFAQSALHYFPSAKRWR